jgi:hypothetical protein
MPTLKFGPCEESAEMAGKLKRNRQRPSFVMQASSLRSLAGRISSDSSGNVVGNAHGPRSPGASVLLLAHGHTLIAVIGSDA